MNKAVKPPRKFSACPHDCPSTCAVEVELSPEGRVKRLFGAKDNTYTAGVICAKVARYSERIHHPDRLLYPLRRTGPKGSGQFERISWDEALDEITAKFRAAEEKHGPQTVWPYYYAGTMGLVQRDSINRLRHAKGYSGMYGTFCTNMAWTGYIAGTGSLTGPDPREMAVSDFVVIWGTNAVATQVNVMTHAIKARKTRGAKIAVVDVYRTETMKQADMGLIIKPGTDAALACAVMHVLFRDGHADRDYMAKFADVPEELEAHLQSRGPEWAAKITGLSVKEIEDFANLIGTTQRTFFRLGYGFTRSRNGVVSMHAASCIAVVGGHYQYEGGGAFHNNGGIFKLNNSKIEGHELKDPTIRQLDMGQVGRILNGDEEALLGGPPVTAMIIQNTNPMSVAPEQELVKKGFAREDLFTVVHEQFMTETAEMADIVLPATQFLEHDDIYKAGGQQSILFGPKIIEAPGEARENLYLLNELIHRLEGAPLDAHSWTAREHVDWMLHASGYGGLERLERERWIDCQPGFAESHYLNGFGYPDGKFRFKPDWVNVPAPNVGPMGPWQQLPSLPDYWETPEKATDSEPYRLVTAPARSFLNSSFNETESSLKKEGQPVAMLHADDAAALGVADGDVIALKNARGEVHLHAEIGERVRKGTVVSEGLWPNKSFINGNGINTLTGADQVAPFGGMAFHDTRIAIEKL
ncbi:molybdopterin oxidoreductase family protein [Pseudovibrio exalbescens]|uniref:molybdopterin-containing oxidoreductase family protein n=1 Tax=Pseudovibrio exalbescens TaxID=197461 RepID=UPI0023662BBA|nr:molybdopterin oxidoreductase family protein [Pseudovibrio exalbescens]MDD7908892.1 molybdopterin oxidoreductase family protein [Pseudovibrio exalbescens]